MKNNNILWILGLVLVVVVVIVVLVLVFRKKKSGGGGGTAPSIKFSGFAPVDPATSSPWLLQTSYVVAYIDASYNPINHGPISNVVTVSSATGTNPTFIVTAKEGYEVVVYRTAATDLNIAPTPPDGTGSYFVIVPEKATFFTDTSNPYKGPPIGPDINPDIVWDTTSKKNPPFRVNTYYRLALSPIASPDMGAPGKEILAQNLSGYNPTMTFTDSTGGENIYKTNVFRSSDNTNWTAAPEIVVSFPVAGTGSFTDTKNVYYAGPPAILASNFILATTPPSVTCDSAPVTNPWGLTTKYTAAFSDYPDSPASCGTMLDTPITFGPQTTAGCPSFTITQPSTSTSGPYYVIVYRTDNGIDPTNPPPAPTTADIIPENKPYTMGTSWTDFWNPFKGVPQVSFGTPIYNTTSKDTLPFRVSTSVIVTLTDITNKLVGVSSPVVFSNPMGTYPAKVQISLPTGYLWKVYNMQVQRQATGVGTPVDVQSGEVTFDNPITTMALIKNPYYTLPPAYSPADFHCNIWDNKNTCSNTCFPACTDSTQCCTNNQCTAIATYDPTNKANVKNKDNTCIGRQQQQLSMDSIKNGCANDPVNPYFMVTTNRTYNTGPTPHTPPSFDGYCVLKSPVNWSIGTLYDPGNTDSTDPYPPTVADTSVMVSSPFDPAGPPTEYTGGTGYGLGCDLAKSNDYCHTCSGKACDQLPFNKGFVNDQTACGADEFALPFQSYDDSGILTGTNICLKFK